jgi:hypothetical protein
MLAIAENVILRFSFGYLDIHAFSFTCHAIAEALLCNRLMTRGEHLLRGRCTPIQTRPAVMIRHLPLAVVGYAEGGVKLCKYVDNRAIGLSSG